MRMPPEFFTLPEIADTIKVRETFSESKWDLWLAPKFSSLGIETTVGSSLIRTSELIKPFDHWLWSNDVHVLWYVIHSLSVSVRCAFDYNSSANLDGFCSQSCDGVFCHCTIRFQSFQWPQIEWKAIWKMGPFAKRSLGMQPPEPLERASGSVAGVRFTMLTTQAQALERANLMEASEQRSRLN